MIPKEMSTHTLEFCKIAKDAKRRIQELGQRQQKLDLMLLDLEHEADPRNHIDGMPRKRKVSSREAMDIGLRLKNICMERRDVKDELATLGVIMQWIDVTKVDNISKFIRGAEGRKYARRVDQTV